MHLTAVILLAAAGLCYCAAAVVRWLLTAATDERRPAHMLPLWIGLTLHSVALVLSLLDASQRGFAYGVLAVWAAVASLFFVSGYLASPSRTILVLPMGGMALLVAMAALTGTERIEPVAEMAWIVRLHVGFMATHLALMLVAGAAGGLYLMAAAMLKSPTPRALRLPSLPRLELLTERGLVVATALLLGGLATGGAAMQLAPAISLAQPSIVLAMITMALLVTALALRATGWLSRRGAAHAALVCMVVSALGAFSQVVKAHG